MSSVLNWIFWAPPPEQNSWVRYWSYMHLKRKIRHHNTDDHHLRSVKDGTVKVMCKLEQTTKARRGGERYSSTLSLTSVLDGGGWSTPRPGRFTSRERLRVPKVQEAKWAPAADLNGCGKFRPLPGFDPRTVHPVASRYIDWAIPAHYDHTDALKTPSFKPEHTHTPTAYGSGVHTDSDLAITTPARHALARSHAADRHHRTVESPITKIPT